jgi:hypothetical protein
LSLFNELPTSDQLSLMGSCYAEDDLVPMFVAFFAMAELFLSVDVHLLTRLESKIFLKLYTDKLKWPSEHNLRYHQFIFLTVQSLIF